MTADELWAEFSAEQNISAPHDTWAFCGGGEAGDRLAGLVLKGNKTATASAYPIYEAQQEPVPSTGCYSVIVYDDGEAACIIRDTKVSVVPFREVSEHHACLEGEGDRSLAYWRTVHKEAFSSELTAVGIPFSEDIPVVLEEFEVVYTSRRVPIETKRLLLVPLTARQLRQWVSELPALEKALDCQYDAEPTDGFFGEIIRSQAEKAENDCAHYLWHTFWFLIRKSDRRVVGSMDFKDVPDKSGRVEIGYGLGKSYTGNGYMTEAVTAFCRWGLAQKDVLRIVAETETDNFPSHRVLTRCGFRICSRGETLWWALE